MRAILKWVVYGWAATTFVSVVAGLLIMLHHFGSGGDRKIDKASNHDVRFVLNWCGLGEQRTEKVLHSLVAERSFTGDHVDGYAIKITQIEITELPEASADRQSGWYRGDKAGPVLRDAIRLANGSMSAEHIAWFPKEADILTDRYYVWVWDIWLHGLSPTATRIIFVRPTDKMVFYADVKM